MDHEASSYHYPQLFGGLMLTAALLGFSTTYFNPLSSLPYRAIFHKRKREQKRVRVYIDGCFDLMHYGHANALRQAKSLGDILVVGVVSDEEIIANKGPPVLPMEERLALVRGLKWVDEVIADAPYEITEQFMKTLFDHHKIDYIIHGDDPCLLPDGSDAYALAKNAGRYKEIKRTEGVSSTDIVGNTPQQHNSTILQRFSFCILSLGRILALSDAPKDVENHQIASQFLPTSRRIVQFSNGKGPGLNARVVYIDGAFDLFHAGHAEALRCARQLGDFLLVGIHTDQIVREKRGKNYPIMNLHERSLSVLSFRYVDEVIIGAPLEVSKDMITTFNISLVVRGTVSENKSSLSMESDPYSVPKRMNIFRIIESPKVITTTTIAQRVLLNHEAYTNRNRKKVASESKYYEDKVHVLED